MGGGWGVGAFGEGWAADDVEHVIWDGVLPQEHGGAQGGWGGINAILSAFCIY